MFQCVNHIAIYTLDRDKAVEFYQNVLGMELKFKLVSPSDGIKIAMMEIGGLQIEILEDPATMDGCDVAARNTENHFALQTDDIQATVAELKAKGADFEPRGIYLVPDFGGRDINVCFLHGPNGERIEILQYMN